MFKNITASQMLWILVTILLIVFVSQNLDPIPVRFIVWTFSVPTFLLIIIAYLVGFYTSMITRNSVNTLLSSRSKSSKTPPDARASETK